MAPTVSGPDTPDFFFYSVRIHNTEHLEQQIREAGASVAPVALGRVWQEMKYRLYVCRVTNVTRVELR
jgi:hypothetical protein